MQLTGLVGESYILSTLASDHAVLRESILRFIAWLLIRKLSASTS